MTIVTPSNTAAALRGLPLAFSVAMLAACGGSPAQSNGTAAAAPADATPVRNALAEFDQVCSRAQEREAYLAAAPGAGWEPHQPAADSPLGRIIAMGEAAIRQVPAQTGQPGEARIENNVFRKTANGRELFLVVSQVQVPGMERSLECRVYDFAGPAPTEAEITAWAPTRANNRVNEQGLNAYGWQPGFRQGFSRIDVTHLDPSSPLRAQVPISGLSITAFQGPTTAE
jgi:hypothetical protein